MVETITTRIRNAVLVVSFLTLDENKSIFFPISVSAKLITRAVCEDLVCSCQSAGWPGSSVVSMGKRVGSGFDSWLLALFLLFVCLTRQPPLHCAQFY